MEYSSDQLYSQNIGAVTKKYLLELRLVQVLYDKSGIFGNSAPVQSRVSRINGILLYVQ